MNKQTVKRAVFVAIAGAVALGAATPSWAAPVLSSTSAVNNAVPSVVTDVRYYRGYRGYRGHHYHDNGAGVALGILGVAGAVAGAAAYGYAPQEYYGGPRYYRHGYYGNPGYYQQDYGQDYYGQSPD